jgi:hypothetical protein
MAPELVTSKPQTFTSDDQKIASMIKDGVNEVTTKLDEIGDAGSLPVMLDVFRDFRDFASLEQIRIGIYQASSCTQLAAEQYRHAVDFLAFVAAGAVGTAPGGGEEAGQALGAALLAVQAFSCS